MSVQILTFQNSFTLTNIHWSKHVTSYPSLLYSIQLIIWRPVDSLIGKEWTVTFNNICVYITDYTSICLKCFITPVIAEYTKRKQIFLLRQESIILMWLIAKAASVKYMRTLLKHVMNTICHIPLLDTVLHTGLGNDKP